MTESSWEATRSAQRKRSHLIVFVSLPVIFLGAILFINNRDLLMAPRKEVPAEKPVPDSIAKPSTVKNPLHGTAEIKKVLTKKSVPDTAAGSPQADNHRKTEEKRAVHKDAVKPAPPAVKDTVKPPPTGAPAISPVSDTVQHLLSETLPPVTCSLNNRKDIVISLTLELFFRDEDDRALLRLYREDLKVMIMRCVLSAELPDMKIHVLEKHLLENINSIFDHKKIIALKIRNIQIEKASG